MSDATELQQAYIWGKVSAMMHLQVKDQVVIICRVCGSTIEEETVFLKQRQAVMSVCLSLLGSFVSWHSPVSCASLLISLTGLTCCPGYIYTSLRHSLFVGLLLLWLLCFSIEAVGFVFFFLVFFLLCLSLYVLPKSLTQFSFVGFSCLFLFILWLFWVFF